MLRAPCSVFRAACRYELALSTVWSFGEFYNYLGIYLMFFGDIIFQLKLISQLLHGKFYINILSTQLATLRLFELINNSKVQYSIT